MMFELLLDALLNKRELAETKKPWGVEYRLRLHRANSYREVIELKRAVRTLLGVDRGQRAPVEFRPRTREGFVVLEDELGGQRGHVRVRADGAGAVRRHESGQERGG